MKCFICLFGDEVRLYYFIVLHPACSASRCWHVMTVLAKQRSPLALCCLRSRLPSPPSGLLRGRKPGWSQIIIQYSRNNSMIFPIPGGKKIGSHYLPRYTRYRVIAGRVIKGGHCIKQGKHLHFSAKMIAPSKLTAKKNKMATDADVRRRPFHKFPIYAIVFLDLT